MPSATRVPAPRVAGLVGLALVLVGLAAFWGVYDWVREAEDLAALDQPIVELLAGLRSPVLTAVLLAVTTISGPVVLPILVAAGGLLYGLRAREWRSAALLVGSMIVAVGVATAIKVAVGRERPSETLWVIPGAESSASFPSGHTIGAATFLLVLGYLAWVHRPTWRTAVMWLVGAVLGMGLVAFSRMYLGYHFATDILASMTLAVAVLGGVVIVDRERAAGAALATVGHG
ncbi:MAG: phosphatase PAP2 family protein [Actinomycetales bacterium]|nr:phosphatase PAP2 family protein [Actinomycetales bacterium]